MDVKRCLLGAYLFLRHGPCKVVEWREQASYDALTGAYTSYFFRLLAQYEIARAKRSGEYLGLLFIDLNDFKQVNDSEGHIVGNAILQSTVRLLKKICRREVDVVCRWGGDEFVVLLPRTDLAMAWELARKLNEAKLSSPKGRIVTLSCGAAAGKGNISLESLLQAADEGMYAAKTAKKSSMSGP